MKTTSAVFPLLIVDRPGGPVIQCLCGAESAVIRNGLANRDMVGLRSSGPAQAHASADLTGAGVMRMVLHAKSCVRGQNELQARMAR